MVRRGEDEMSRFDIDTGYTPLTAADYCHKWLRDMLPADATAAQIVTAQAHHIIGDMKRPVKLDTVRTHLIGMWQFLRLLAEENPGLWDEVWVAYYERLEGGAD